MFQQLSGQQYHSGMEKDEVPFIAGPKSQSLEAIVQSLNLEGIPGRLVAIEDVDSKPEWACTFGNEVYVVVPRERLGDARELARWVSRVCLNCEAVLFAKVRSCQQCGTPHKAEPGPGW